MGDYRTICYKSIKWLGGTMEKDEFVEKSEKHLKNLERLLGDKKHFVENRLTAADICVYDILDTMVEALLPGHLGTLFPKLASFREHIGKLPNIVAHHETEQFK